MYHFSTILTENLFVVIKFSSFCKSGENPPPLRQQCCHFRQLRHMRILIVHNYEDDIFHKLECIIKYCNPSYTFKFYIFSFFQLEKCLILTTYSTVSVAEMKITGNI